jgi:hypothetical protein
MPSRLVSAIRATLVPSLAPGSAPVIVTSAVASIDGPPKKTNARPQSTLLFALLPSPSSNGAPTSRSGAPAPFTSPTNAIEDPKRAPSSDPRIVRLGDVEGPAALPK